MANAEVRADSADEFSMKRTVLAAAIALPVFAILFGLVWLILRVLSVDFPVLGAAVGTLSTGVALALTGYIFREALPVRWSLANFRSAPSLDRAVPTTEPVPAK